MPLALVQITQPRQSMACMCPVLPITYQKSAFHIINKKVHVKVIDRQTLQEVRVMQTLVPYVWAFDPDLIPDAGKHSIPQIARNLVTNLNTADSKEMTDYHSLFCRCNVQNLPKVEPMICKRFHQRIPFFKFLVLHWH